MKVALAAAISLVGGYGLLCERAYITSSDAVVSAYVLDVRTPIDGIVTGLPNTTGVAVHEGQVLGQVENLRSDRQQLNALRTDEATAITASEAIAAERDALESQRQSLLARVGDHRAVVTSRLELQVTEATRVLAAQQLALRQATTELDRGRSLHDAGILASAGFDKVVSAQAIATQQVAAQEAELASLRVQVASAARGINAEPGTGNEVSYSRQRADEIVMRPMSQLVLRSRDVSWVQFRNQCRFSVLSCEGELPERFVPFRLFGLASAKHRIRLKLTD